jgi:Secretion system C-terminal sorting domain
MIKIIVFILLNLWYCTSSEAHPIQVRLKTQPFDSLTSAELQTLAALSGNANVTQVKARAITEIVTQNRTYKEALPIVAQAQSRMHKPRLKNAYSKVSDDMPSSINVFPNPANDYIKIEDTKLQNGIFSIYNAQGGLIKTVNTSTTTTISLTDFSSGAYFYEYNVEGVVVERNKLQIIK